MNLREADVNPIGGTLKFRILCMRINDQPPLPREHKIAVLEKLLKPQYC